VSPGTLPLASVSLDLDNLWSYLKTHGNDEWRNRPTYLPEFAPVILGLLEDVGLRITFFVVGRDADRDENADAIRSLAAAGHEIGNHSYEHEPWLHRYGAAQIDAELALAEQAIERATGRACEGFRGPGYSWSPTLLETLCRRGYRFDASTLPTWIGPLARAYYFSGARLTPEQRVERAALFGEWGNGRWPNRPYRWELGEGQRLLEIPVTVFPGLRTPFHFSYLLWLSRFSERVMWAYLRSALAWCRRTGTEPSVLLHPLDVLGSDVSPALRFFPGMDQPTDRKAALLRRVLGTIRESFTPVTMGMHATHLSARPDLALRDAGPRHASHLAPAVA
jgi:peptidoglycan/xylan/chitin deacetylase (PgdA/CDA1 family)